LVLTLILRGRGGVVYYLLEYCLWGREDEINIGMLVNANKIMWFNNAPHDFMRA
jgi:hypothetical protein